MSLVTELDEGENWVNARSLYVFEASKGYPDKRSSLAVRTIGILLALRVLVVLGGILAAALLPRFMGPAVFGQYALLTSITHWFSFLGGLGLAHVVSRQIPDLVQQGRVQEMRRFVGNLLGLRLVAGALAAVVYGAAMMAWLKDIHWIPVLFLTLALAIRSPTGVGAAVFLGQGRIVRWGLPEVFRQWGSLAWIVPGFLLAGLPGAAIGVLVGELLIATMTLAGLKGNGILKSVWIRWKDLVPHLRFGILLYASELILCACERGGEVILKIATGDYVTVGHYGVSNAIYIHAVVALQPIAQAFIPTLVALRSDGNHAELARWTERLLKWLGMGAVLVFLSSAYFAKDLTALFFGSAYSGVAANLVVLSATLVLHALSFVGATLAIVHRRPKIILVAGLARLCIFVGVGVALSPTWGSLGMCAAIFAGVFTQALVFIGYLRDRLPLGRFGLVILLALPFSFAAFFPLASQWNFLLFLLSLLGYLMMVWRVRLISAREWRLLFGAFSFSR